MTNATHTHEELLPCPHCGKAISVLVEEYQFPSEESYDDMLDTLKKFVEHFGDPFGNARAAISRAEGVV